MLRHPRGGHERPVLLDGRPVYVTVHLHRDRVVVCVADSGQGFNHHPGRRVGRPTPSARAVAACTSWAAGWTAWWSLSRSAAWSGWRGGCSLRPPTSDEPGSAATHAFGGFPRPGVARSSRAGSTTSCLLRGVSTSRDPPDSLRIGKIADELPPRLPVTAAYGLTRNGTAAPSLAGEYRP